MVKIIFSYWDKAIAKLPLKADINSFISIVPFFTGVLDEDFWNDIYFYLKIECVGGICIAAGATPLCTYI